MPGQQTNTITMNGKTVLVLVLPLVALCLGKTSSGWLTAGNMHLFSLQFLSLFIEAAPFLLLGSIVSGIIEEFVEPDMLLRFTPKHRISQVCAGSLLGFLFPVCECGVVPVVRRLLRKGMPATMAIAFLLGAPVMNPIVLFGTYKAFGLSSMFLWRIVGTVLVACTVALLIAPKRLKHNKPIKNVGRQHRSIHHALRHAADDFLGIGAYLVIGALLASAAQSFVPDSALLPVSTQPLLSVLAMELLAFVMSVCSSVDAFIALGFAGTFTGGSVLSFLVFGPMVDIKSTLMFLGVFPKKIVIRLVLLPLLLATILGIFANLFGLLA